MAKKNILLRSKKKKAQALLDGNRLEEARVLLEQLAETDRRDAETRLMLGVIAGRQGDHQRAAEHLGVACACSPGRRSCTTTSVSLCANLASVLQTQGYLEDAVASCRESLRCFPGNHRACPKILQLSLYVLSIYGCLDQFYLGVDLGVSVSSSVNKLAQGRL